MTLIADAGSSGTQWALLSADSAPIHLETEAINPAIQSAEQIAGSIAKVADAIAAAKPGAHISHIYFYGAGCNYRFSAKVETELRKSFAAARIEVESDMLGACRALWGDNPGYAGILGTGSNSCYYDGHAIAASVSSLGFILGDEGSGNNLGRKLLKKHLRGELPPQVSRRLADFCPMSEGEVIERIYRQPGANRFLASFARFVGENIHEPSLRAIVEQTFDEYFADCVSNIAAPAGTPREIGLAGSIAHYFADSLKASAGRHGFAVKAILSSPLAGLIAYHSPEEAR